MTFTTERPMKSPFRGIVGSFNTYSERLTFRMGLWSLSGDVIKRFLLRLQVYGLDSGLDCLWVDSADQPALPCTDENLNLLCASNDVQWDGTFKTAPKLFHQLFEH